MSLIVSYLFAKRRIGTVVMISYEVLDILMPRFLVKARVQDQDLVLGQGVAATEYEVKIFV